MYQNLTITHQGGITTVTINRPDKLNALNIKTMEELDALFTEMAHDTSIKAVILTGAGEKAFVAGADISEFTLLNAETGKKMAENGQRIFKKIEDFPKPVVAAVNGFALGGGCELAMACHMRVATVSAKFAQPEVNLGIIPGYGGTQRLVQLVGKGRAMEWMTTADMITAERARECGLVNHVLQTKEEMLTKAHEILTKVISKAPKAIAGVIAGVNAAVSSGDGYAVEAQQFGLCCASEDFKEGVSAFLGKRTAQFQGI